MTTDRYTPIIAHYYNKNILRCMQAPLNFEINRLERKGSRLDPMDEWTYVVVFPAVDFSLYSQISNTFYSWDMLASTKKLCA